MPRACSMSAVVKPPMPPPTMMTFIAQLTTHNSRRIMVRNVDPAQRFSPDVVDGAPVGRSRSLSICACYINRRCPPRRGESPAARGEDHACAGLSRRLVVDAEAAVPRARHQPRELRLADVNERRVIAAFEIDVRLLLDAVVDDDVEIVAFADGGNRAELAVRDRKSTRLNSSHLGISYA